MCTLGDAADVNQVPATRVATFGGRLQRLPPRFFVAAAVNHVAQEARTQDP